MGRHTILAAILVLVVIGSGLLVTALRDEPPSIAIEPAPPTTISTPSAGIVESPVTNESQEPEIPRRDAQWGRAQITWDPEHWPPNRGDWSNEPERWKLRPVSDVREIPSAVRDALGRLDCAVPTSQPGAVTTSVIWGEFERPGQRDLAILCVHADKTSSTYVFWGANPTRRDVMPQSGNAITTEPRASVEARIEPESPRESDMPVTIDHDGIEIGCCECCSTIFYRHRGQWFTLPGAD